MTHRRLSTIALVTAGCLHGLFVDRGTHPIRRYYYGRDRDPQRVLDERWQRDLERWRSISRGTTGSDPKSSPVGLWQLAADQSFRLVDRHAKSCGPRYTLTGERDVTWPPGLQYKIVDAHGNTQWLAAGIRVRPIARQPEVYHSAACRALKAAHRRSL